LVAAATAATPSERPSAAALQRAPLLWNAEQRLHFLRKVRNVT